MSTEYSIINMQMHILCMTQNITKKLRNVTIITVTNYKYNYNTTKPKLKSGPQNKKKKLLTDARYISST